MNPSTSHALHDKGLLLGGFGIQSTKNSNMNNTQFPLNHPKSIDQDLQKTRSIGSDVSVGTMQMNEGAAKKSRVGTKQTKKIVLPTI